METIELDYQDILIVDPGYIKRVVFADELRFDALKLVEVLHEGDDGEFTVETPRGVVMLGVDSGRIWKLQAEFDCKVELDAGLSGYCIIRKGE